MKVLAPCVFVHVGPVARPLIDASLNFHRTATLKYFPASPAEQKWLFNSIIIPWQKLYHNLPFSNMRSWFTNVMFQVLNKIRFNISCYDKKTQPIIKIGTKLAGLIQSLMVSNFIYPILGVCQPFLSRMPCGQPVVQIMFQTKCYMGWYSWLI